jgi:propionyl-CoA synthetase
MHDQSTLHSASLADAEAFWRGQARSLDWSRLPERALEVDAGRYRWFASGRMNTCFNAVDRHVLAGHGDRPAVLFESPVTGTSRRITYAELLDETSRAATALRERGVGVGDRVLIYMPMIPEAIVAMLACARIGAIHSVVFGGFAPAELAARIRDASPRIIVTASCGIEKQRVIPYLPIVEAALSAAEHQARVLVVQRPQLPAVLSAGRDEDWADAVAEAPLTECTAVRGDSPLYILYTSGTTGRPKGVVRDTGGHAVALMWSMKNFYGARPGDVFWAASDIGWVVGHSYIVYGPLLAGCTTLLFEGKPVGTPDAGVFFEIIERHRVGILFTAPTTVRAIRSEDPSGNLRNDRDLGSLRALFMAGERLDTDTYAWAKDVFGCPVIDHWWQTETGWPIVGTAVGVSSHTIRPGSPGRPLPGWSVRVVDADGRDAPPGVKGAVVLALPLAPGGLLGLWGDDERFEQAYLREYPGNYLTGDGGHLDEDGYLFISGRIDDEINVAGHRLSTAGIEEIAARHPQILECAVVGVPDEIKGLVPHLFAVISSPTGSLGFLGVLEEVNADIRRLISPIATLGGITPLARLPKTRSGKILRGTIRSIAAGQEFVTPSTIEDPAALVELREALDLSGGASSEPPPADWSVGPELSD